MLDVATFIVALLLVAGVASATHGVIKPAVDWISPPAPSESEKPTTERDVWLEMVRERKRQRIGMYREMEKDLQKVRRRE